MRTVFPEPSVSIFALVVFLRGAPGDELHALGYDVPASVFYQEMNVV